ncbi:MAG: CoA-binding protein [Actinobacteria bacterium]|jgi:predicted CoA-binding protein|nr:CoA-binding protein [Actinomycetota bacterium]
MIDCVAIVGASADRSKFSNKAVRAFVQKGWTVFPVNPKAKEIEGLPSYASIADVPARVHCVSMYVPPEAGRHMLAAVAAHSPREFFLNPGSGDDALIEEAKALGLAPIQACSIVGIGLRPDMFPDE